MKQQRLKTKIALDAERKLTYPFKQLMRGNASLSERKLRNAVANKTKEMLISRTWEYEGTSYNIVRVMPKLQPSGSYILVVEMRDDEGNNKVLPLYELIKA